MNRLHVLVFVATALLCAGAFTARADRLPEADRAKMAELVERAMRFDPRSPQPDVLIGGLRMMRDPALRPLFESLAGSDVPGLRMHGALGMAELDGERGLDPDVLRRIENPLEQTSLFSQAARTGHINERVLSTILSWDDLAPDLEAAALQRGLALGMTIDAERVRRLAQNESVAVALMGGLLLLELGSVDEAHRAFDRFFAMPADVGRPIAGMLLQHIRRESLGRAAPFVERVGAAAGEDGLLRIEAIHTMLHIDPSRGVAQWLAAYDADADPAMRLMLAMAALESADAALARLFDRLESDRAVSELLADIGRAGRALSEERGRVEALVALAGHGHGPTCQWLAGRAESLPDDVAAPALLAIIESAERVGDRRADVRSAAISAAAALAERAPESLADALRGLAERRHQAMCQSLLVGALRSRASSASFLPADVRWPGRQSEALADLASARFGGAVSEELLERVRGIALGRASLPEVFRLQAAWVSLRAAGEHRRTLEGLLG